MPHNVSFLPSFMKLTLVGTGFVRTPVSSRLTPLVRWGNSGVQLVAGKAISGKCVMFPCFLFSFKRGTPRVRPRAGAEGSCRGSSVAVGYRFMDGRSRDTPVGRRRKEWKENGLGAPCRTMPLSSHYMRSRLKPKVICFGSSAVLDALHHRIANDRFAIDEVVASIYIVRTLFSFTPFQASQIYGGRLISVSHTKPHHHH